MAKLELTRRQFIELAGAAATATQLDRPSPLEGLTVAPNRSDAGVRNNFSLNRSWRFQRQESPGSAIEAKFIGAEKPGYDDSSWELVWLPHSWDVGPDNPFSTRGHFRGIGWYRLRIDVPRAWQGRCVRLNFKGVFQVADVWLNGVHVGQHVGGYTGFSLDLTPAMKCGDQNLLVVKVNDTLSPYVAPAIENNVNVYGGIYRTVSLSVLNPIHIRANGVWVNCEKKDKDASVTIHGFLRNQSSSSTYVKVEHRILDRDGAVQAQARSDARLKLGEELPFSPTTVIVSSPSLWSPESPHLYTLQTTVRNGSDVVDQDSIRFGIRFMEHDSVQGFLLNGEPINLHGMNRRQDYGFLGDAVPEAVGVKDVHLLKQLGANFVRTAHYPQDPAVLDACDELGILVWTEIPNIKLYVYPPGIDVDGADGVSWTRFSRPFMRNLKAQLKEMIEQNRNRPSVIIWGLADDLSRYQYQADFVELSDAAHALDPTRWTAGRAPHVTDIVDATVYDDLIGQHNQHPEDRYIWNEWGSFHSERGKEGPALIRDGHPPFLPDCEAAILNEGFMLQWNAMPWLGTAHWCMCDCGEPGGSPTLSLWEHVEGNPIKPRWPVNDYYGCLDMWRLPKTSFYLFQSQWTEKPMIHIAGHWTWPGETGKPRQIRIYSNCDSVELFLNGRSLGSRKPASGEQVWADFKKTATKYQGIEDMIHSLSLGPLPGAYLRHAPFVWDNVPYQPGTLIALGKKDGIAVKDERGTAGEPARLSLISDQPTLAADALDVALIQARVLDSKGVLVPTADPWISFSVDGPGRLLGGTTEIDAISGIAAINVQSTDEDGQIWVHAESHGLQSGSIELVATSSAGGLSAQ
ncbi:MAG: glycoside hydrolase family 2 TIM barrel-domain containing protein [Acidobacteriaceae bacterium]